MSTDIERRRATGEQIEPLKKRENSKRIAERMGWSSIKMLDRYSHITPHMQQEAADALGEIFSRHQTE
ncbi:hypothetical protein [Paenibacillus phocaensis]|uniref:hypothetical protein n=1 Tax=Paenibacillus phocaensis TaxID=1776378 RepID=UPI000839CA96|nr:hypothetical protein [Paenibacillus phocaensis]